jgi:hypothetical protein
MALHGRSDGQHPERQTFRQSTLAISDGSIEKYALAMEIHSVCRCGARGGSGRGIVSIKRPPALASSSHRQVLRPLLLLIMVIRIDFLQPSQFT